MRSLIDMLISDVSQGVRPAVLVNLAAHLRVIQKNF